MRKDYLEKNEKVILFLLNMYSGILSI